MEGFMMVMLWIIPVLFLGIISLAFLYGLLKETVFK